MRLGLFSVMDHYPAELGRTTAELYTEVLEQAEAADEWGFDSFWVAEHHFHEYGAVPRPPVFLAAAAQRTRRIRLGAGVVVLPFDHPLRVAEDYAMVDVLSAGRLNLGVGSGYLQHEYAGFRVDPGEKRERLNEALEILLRAWTGERVSWAGRHHRVDGVQLNVRPVQQPRPPIWVATLRTDGGARVGARGLPAMFIPYASAETLAQMKDGLRDYRAAFAAAGGRPEEATAPFGFHTYCAESTEAARAEARSRSATRTRSFASRVATRPSASPTSSPSRTSAGCPTSGCSPRWSSWPVTCFRDSARGDGGQLSTATPRSTRPPPLLSKHMISIDHYGHRL